MLFIVSVEIVLSERVFFLLGVRGIACMISEILVNLRLGYIPTNRNGNSKDNNSCGDTEDSNHKTFSFAASEKTMTMDSCNGSAGGTVNYITDYTALEMKKQ